MNGRKTKKNIFLALKWYLEALKQNSSEAEFGIKKIFSIMKELNLDSRKKIFSQFSPHEQIPFIRYLMAKMYLKGYGV